MTTALAVYLTGYAISVALSIGWQFAYFEDKYPSIDWEEHLGFAIIWSLFGMLLWPATLLISFCMCGFAKHGWRLKHRY